MLEPDTLPTPFTKFQVPLRNLDWNTVTVALLIVSLGVQ